jgi:hypothetical protein
VTEAEAAAQAEVRTIVEELDALRARLANVHDRLPVPPQETAMLLGEEEMDVATEVRSVIECVLNDSLLCRARHKMRYAASRIMPSRPCPRLPAA